MNIIITGNRKGIGRFLTETYLGKGHFIFGCSRNETDLVHLNYHHFILDVSDENSVKSMFSEIRKMGKTIDVLINNAGLAAMNHSILTPIITLDNLFKTNFYGTFIFSREASKMMKKANYGRIINFSTVAVPLNLEGESIYASTKSAVETLTKIMAKEVAEMGITINAVAPTPVPTDLIKTIPKNKIDLLINQQSIKRIGEYNDVLNVVDFFIKPESSFITGQIIYLGGIN
jgi:3-oxoacyl-[acyl-carrier protein] reductase